MPRIHVERKKRRWKKESGDKTSTYATYLEVHEETEEEEEENKFDRLFMWSKRIDVIVRVRRHVNSVSGQYVPCCYLAHYRFSVTRKKYVRVGLFMSQRELLNL